MRPLDRDGKAGNAVHRVALTLEGQGGPRQQPLEHAEGFLEPADPNRRGVEGHTGPLVLVPQPAGPDAQLEAAPRQQIERCRLLGQHHRVPIVVVEHQAADPQGPGGTGGGHQRHQRRELIAERLSHEVVAQQQRRVAERFGSVGRVQQSLSAGDRFADHPEPERSSSVHAHLSTGPHR